jgi:hypothetical protein
MSALVERKDLTADDLYTPEDEARLKVILDHAYVTMLRTMHLLTLDYYADRLDPRDFRLDDPSTRAVLAHAGTRIKDISETTRQALAALLQEGQAAGLTTFEIQERIAHLFEITYANRAEVIARTEIGEAQRVSAIDRYTATGLVDRVFIIDGEDDEPCRSRNGKTVPLSEAPTLGHPQCTLVLTPVLREGVV